MLAAAVLWVGASPLRAGTIPGAESESPNNNDYKGAFGDNPNLFIFFGGVVHTLEEVVAVVDSGGTTEYAVLIGGHGKDLDNVLEMRIGFGTGENFVSASETVPELTFDAPDFDPEPASIPMGFPFTEPFFTLIRPSGDSLLWQGHDEICNEVFCITEIGFGNHDDLFHISVDVPDLPDSVMEYYLPGDLPGDFPPGAKAFTIRASYIDEPIEPPAPTFRRGDVDDNGTVQLTDAVRVLNFLFTGGEEPTCTETADANDSGAVELTYAVRILAFLFQGGVEIPPPGPEACGTDPVDSLDLDCESYTSC